MTMLLLFLNGKVNSKYPYNGKELSNNLAALFFVFNVSVLELVPDFGILYLTNDIRTIVSGSTPSFK